MLFSGLHDTYSLVAPINPVSHKFIIPLYETDRDARCLVLGCTSQIFDLALGVPI